MAVIKVNFQSAIKSTEDIVAAAKRLEELQKAVAGIKLDGILEGSWKTAFDQAIRNLSNQVTAEAAKMDSLGQALQQIVEAYRSVEESLGSSAKLAAAIAASAPAAIIGADKRKWYQRFLDWLLGKEPDDYDTTTLQQEQAADERMRRMLQRILSSEEFSEETWEKASIEERKKILQDYMNAVIAVYGLKHVDPTIHWDPDAEYTNKEVLFGYYSPRRHTVTLNEQVLSDRLDAWDSYRLLGTVAHELRHAYQHEAIDDPTGFMVSQQTLDAWKYNFDHPIDSDLDYPGYYNQAIEQDARSFEVNRPSTERRGPTL